MKSIRKTLDPINDTSGYTLIELMMVILIFAIAIVPIYTLLTSGAKIQKASEETYEATLQAQSLLQSVKKQMETDLLGEQEFERKLIAKPVKPWLIEPGSPGYPATFDNSLINFFSQFSDPNSLIEQDQKDKYAKEVKDFQTKFQTDDFLYEVHIWHLDKGKLQAIDSTSKVRPGPVPDVTFIEYGSVKVPTFVEDNTSAFTMLEIKDAIKDYFDYKELLLWTKPVSSGVGLQAVGQIYYKEPEDISSENLDKITLDAYGIDGKGIDVNPIDSYGGITNNKVQASYTRISEKKQMDNLNNRDSITQQIVLEEIGSSLMEEDIIQLEVDLTTFENPTEIGPYTDVIRIENKTKAKVVVAIYNEMGSSIAIYPIQHSTKGSIVIEEKSKRNPKKNFIIGIIVRDAVNSTFGEENKILSKIVDVYSYDYNIK